MSSSNCPPAGQNIQTPVPPVILAHFLRQIQSHHIRTPNKSPLPLHYNSQTQGLCEFPWPWDAKSPGGRVAPSNLEAFRRTHEFRTPSCLCAFLDGTDYTETQIGIVEAHRAGEVGADVGHTSLSGEYVAVCAKRRCGYFLRLEMFYPLYSLKLQKCPRREIPLHPQELNYISDLERYTRGASGGIRQFLSSGTTRRLPVIYPSDAPANGKQKLIQDLLLGVPEAEFWEIFAQCFVCKAVMFHQGISAYHICEPAERGHRRFKPYSISTRPNTHLGARLLRSVGDVPEEQLLRAMHPSPTPTEIVPHSDPDWDHIDEFFASPASEQEATDQEEAVESDGSDSELDEIPVLSDDFELPSVLELTRGSHSRSGV